MNILIIKTFTMLAIECSNYQATLAKCNLFLLLKDLIQPMRQIPSPPRSLYAENVGPAKVADNQETCYFPSQKKPFSIDRFEQLIFCFQ